MAGYWPSVQVPFLNKTKSRSTETPKKRTRSISSETDPTSTVNKVRFSEHQSHLRIGFIEAAPGKNYTIIQ